MTFQELLQACSKGSMPLVNHKKFGLGRVTVIKDQADRGHYRGVAVRFFDLPYDSWFHDTADTDKRSNYLRDLSLYDDGSIRPTV